MQSLAKALTVHHGVTPIPNLTIGIYRFHFRLLDPLHLRAFHGAQWRGVFGLALRQTHCLTGAPDCAGCPLIQKCNYNQIFETPVPHNEHWLSKTATAPHPYVIRVNTPKKNQNFKARDVISLDMALIGNGNDYLQAIIPALERAGRLGISKARSRFELTSIQQESPPGSNQWSFLPMNGHRTPEVRPLAIPAVPKAVRVHIETPMRLKVNGKLVRAHQFEFHHLYRPLQRRLGLLQAFFSESTLEIDFKGLTERSQQVAIEDVNLRWYRWKRESSRSGELIAMPGLLGSFVIRELAEFWPYLYYGQFVNAGKAVTMGFGRYHLQIIDDPKPVEGVHQ